MIITIDGPTASGKSTVARELARSLGFLYLSSGLLYRGLAYCLHAECQYTPEQMQDPHADDIARCVHDMKALSYETSSVGERVLLHGVDITTNLKTPEIDDYASRIAMTAIVRNAINAWQHRLAQGKDAVVEGRDCGSTVFAQAAIKFFLTACDEIRAQRWQRDQSKKGNQFTHQEAYARIQERDRRDTTRTLAPLIIPRGATVVDNSTLTVEQTVEYMITATQSFLDKKKSE